MKRFAINTALWYVLLSFGMFLAFILFDWHGHMGVRLIISMVFAIIYPLDKIIDKVKNKKF